MRSMIMSFIVCALCVPACAKTRWRMIGVTDASKGQEVRRAGAVVADNGSVRGGGGGEHG